MLFRFLHMVEKQNVTRSKKYKIISEEHKG